MLFFVFFSLLIQTPVNRLVFLEINTEMYYRYLMCLLCFFPYKTLRESDENKILHGIKKKQSHFETAFESTCVFSIS